MKNKLKEKILSPAALAKKLSALKKKKKKIVFTNGCFDILHRGHVTYLNQARAKGDVLIVAVNADVSVQKLKGPTRPINPLEDRQWVLAALECVDFVTAFSEDTPLKIIQKLMPNVLVKGGDWKPEQIVGSSTVIENGGRVYSLPFVKDKSTSAIIDKIIHTT